MIRGPFITAFHCLFEAGGRPGLQKPRGLLVDFDLVGV